MKKVLSILLCGVLALTITGCGSNEAKEAKEDQKDYYCETGTLKGQNCETVETEEAVATCEDDYKLTDGKCVKTTTANATATKTCSEGFTLSGNNCLSNETYDKVTTQECRLPKEFDIGEYTDIDGKTSKNTVYEENGECWYSACTHWYEGKCDGGEINRTEYTTVTACPSDTKEIDGKCYKTSTVKTTYTCKEGKLSGSKCTITDTKDVTNTCKTAGFTYNTESKRCEKITTTKALEK